MRLRSLEKNYLKKKEELLFMSEIKTKKNYGYRKNVNDRNTEYERKIVTTTQKTTITCQVRIFRVVETKSLSGMITASL